MADEVTRDWVVTYKSSSRSPVELWAVIAGVPAGLELGDVTTALELWDRWPQWQARVRPGAIVNVRRRTKRDDELAGDGWAPPVVPWSTLAPVARRVQVELAGPVYAAAKRAARLRGMSLAAWTIAAITAAAADALEAAAEVDGAGVPAPGFVDVPLPLGGAS